MNKYWTQALKENYFKVKRQKEPKSMIVSVLFKKLMFRVFALDGSVGCEQARYERCFVRYFQCFFWAFSIAARVADGAPLRFPSSSYKHSFICCTLAGKTFVACFVQVGAFAILRGKLGLPTPTLHVFDAIFGARHAPGAFIARLRKCSRGRLASEVHNKKIPNADGSGFRYDGS